MNKNEMKTNAKTIATKHNITIINKSVYFSDTNNSMICNGYDNYGTCIYMYINFDMKQYSIQSLSPVCIHDDKWYDI